MYLGLNEFVSDMEGKIVLVLFFFSRKSVYLVCMAFSSMEGNCVCCCFVVKVADEVPAARQGRRLHPWHTFVLGVGRAVITEGPFCSKFRAIVDVDITFVVAILYESTIGRGHQNT